MAFVSYRDVDFIKDMIDTFLQKYDVPEGIKINLHVTVCSSVIPLRIINLISDFRGTLSAPRSPP